MGKIISLKCFLNVCLERMEGLNIYLNSGQIVNKKIGSKEVK